MLLSDQQHHFLDACGMGQTFSDACLSCNYTPFVSPGNEYYVYLLVNPHTDRIFYVGKGIKKRALQHDKDAKNNNISNPFKFRKIKSIHQKESQVSVYYFAINIEEQDAFYIEKIAIKRIGIENLTNILGGRRLLVKEWALAEYESMMPFDQWVAKFSPSEYEKALYHRCKEEYLKISKFGYVCEIEQVAFGNGVKIIQKKRI